MIRVPLASLRPRLRNVAALIACAGALCAGCSTPASAPAATAPAPVAAPATPAAQPPRASSSAQLDDLLATYRRLSKNMTAAEVRTLLGAPAQVKPMTSQGVAAEAWTYQDQVFGGTRQVVAGMQDVPYFDPFTGAPGTTQEPVYKMEVRNVTVTTNLLFVNGRLLEWNQKQAVDRSFQ